jgi:hypothetical protein
VTATQTANDAVTLPWLVKRASILTWFELPRVVAVCAVLLASVAPFAVAVATGQWWLMSIGALPAALLLTGLARFAAIIAGGDRPRVRDAFAVDPVLAVALVVAGTIAGLLVTTPVLQVAGFVVAAIVLLLAPYALAYGAVRGRRGLTTWRGAFILVAFRPSWALTVLSMSLIGGFAIAATVGALAVLVPCILAVFSSAVVGRLLDTIDGVAAAPPRQGSR